MKIKMYNTYLLESLLESMLITSSEFLDLITTIPNDNEIADILHKIIHYKSDIKTNYNLIDQSDKNDEITFIPDNQYQRFVKDGVDPSSKAKSKSKIGRMIRQILVDNGYRFTDSQIEDFVNKFKSNWDLKHGIGRKIEIVKGKDINYWYNQDTYYKIDGTLGNSCMRYERKNDFMNIYADNPDKISMVIVKKDDKLIARALIWNLDDGRIYLDRIYCINDSDFEFVYNWVLKNIGMGDVNRMPSHFKGKGAKRLMCSLSKIDQDTFPYADSMYYLYQELKDGKITGKGFVSNDYDEIKSQKDDSYLVRTIQDTNGGSNVLNCRFSDYKKTWILSSYAVWAADVDSWVHEDEIVKSRFASSNYLKVNCIYNEIVDDWIYKPDSISDDRYGLVYRNMIKDIVVAYTGNKIDPFEIWMDISKSDDKLKIERDLYSGGVIKPFRPDVVPNRFSLYSSDFLVKDYTEDEQVDFLCYKVYKVDGNISRDLKFITFSYYLSSNKFVTEIDAQIFDIPIDRSKVSYVSTIRYVINHDDVPFDKIVSLIEKSNADDSIKEKRIKMAKNIHDYLYENDDDYRAKNILYSNLKEKSENKFLITIEVFNEFWSKFKDNNDIEKYINSGAESELGDELFNHYHENTTIEESDNILNLIHKYFKLYTYFYTLNYDVYDACDLLEKYLNLYDKKAYNTFFSSIENWHDTGAYLIRRIFRIRFAYSVSDYMSRSWQEYRDANNLNMSSSKFRSIVCISTYSNILGDNIDEEYKSLKLLVE